MCNKYTCIKWNHLPTAVNSDISKEVFDWNTGGLSFSSVIYTTNVASVDIANVEVSVTLKSGMKIVHEIPSV